MVSEFSFIGYYVWRVASADVPVVVAAVVDLELHLLSSLEVTIHVCFSCYSTCACYSYCYISV